MGIETEQGHREIDDGLDAPVSLRGGEEARHHGGASVKCRIRLEVDHGDCSGSVWVPIAEVDVAMAAMHDDGSDLELMWKQWVFGLLPIADESCLRSKERRRASGGKVGAAAEESKEEWELVSEWTAPGEESK
ncbi:hypothetical protein M0R45_014681 [Rubus argutus]|uniref:Uncharacterized protein n=1 Tax=Rubus argutus TaxID=59490 RepID=A0AAW1XNP5_RUBAR